MKNNLPWKAQPRVDPFKKREDVEAIRDEGWLLRLKKQAVSNLDDPIESLRITWQHRWNKPLHDRFEDYVLDEVIVELWEQHYFENPKAVERQGLFRKVNKTTGYAYYETGDPVLDEIEREFSEGRVPDLQKLLDGIVDNTQDIFRAKVFVDVNGNMISAQSGLSGTVRAEDGTHKTVTGATVVHDDYTSDDWMNEDPTLKLLKEKMGGG